MRGTNPNMRKMFFAAALLTLLCMFDLPFPERAEALSTADIFRRYAPSVATLLVTRNDGKQGIGTGFLVSGGEILTNFHVIDKAESVAVHFSEEVWYSAKRIIAQDPEKDLALVWVERIDPPLPWLGLSKIRVPEGGDIVVIGSPRGLEKTVTTGIISGYRTFGRTAVLQITAPISGGSSGSPILDTNGGVVGIAIGTLKDSQGLNFAVDAKEIAAFLQTRPFKTPAPTAQSDKQTASSSPQQPQRKAAEVLPFASVMAKLELARPGMKADQVRQSLGEPAQTDERGTGYFASTWDFRNNRALFVVWDRNGVVERSSWIEYYPTKDEASVRARTVTDLAGAQYGKPGASSQSGKSWKRGDATVGIEQQSASNNHMVIFKLTK